MQCFINSTPPTILRKTTILPILMSFAILGWSNTALAFDEPAEGAYRVIVIKVQPEGMSEPPHTTSEIVEEFIPRTDEFYQINSYGKVWFTGENGEPFSENDVYPRDGGFYQIPLEVRYTCTAESAQKNCEPEDPTSCGPDGGSCEQNCSTDFSENSIQAADADIDFSDENTFVIIYLPNDVGDINCTWGGISRTSIVQTNDSAEPLAIKNTLIRTYPGPISHEFGHLFGLSHPSRLDCEEGALLPEHCPTVERGDYMDVLGSGSKVHSSSIFKASLGWLTEAPEGIDPHTGLHHYISVEPTSDGEGTQTFYLSPLSDMNGAVQALKIPHWTRGSLYSHLFVEYRQPLDIDSRMSAHPDVFDGVRLLLGNESSYLFDPILTDDLKDVLPYGATYTDPLTGTEITVGPRPAGFNPVRVDVSAHIADFEPPTITQFEIKGTTPECVTTYQLMAEDVSGISKVVFTIFKGNGQITTIERDSVPAEIALDVAEYERSWISAVVYDDAFEGTDIPDNSTQTDFIEFSGNCDFSAPEIHLLQPAPQTQVDSPIHFQTRISTETILKSYQFMTTHKNHHVFVRIVDSNPSMSPIRPDNGIYEFSSTQNFEPGLYDFKFLATDIHDKTSEITFQLIVTDPTNPCSDDIDNDEDGFVDMEDSGCNDPADPSEMPDCSDGIDNDLDGFIDHQSPISDIGDDLGCHDPFATSEKSIAYGCDDGIDNDNDETVDYLKFGGGDTDCTYPFQINEEAFFLTKVLQDVPNGPSGIDAAINDLDGDGINEIIGFFYDRIIIYHFNLETSEFDTELIYLTIGIKRSHVFADLDGDGIKEIVAAVGSQLLFLKYEENPDFLGTGILISRESATSPLLAADITGDGIDEIIARKVAGEPGIEDDLIVYTYQTDVSKPIRILSQTAINPYGLAAADMTGDGQSELIIKTSTDIVVLKHDPSLSLTENLLIQWSYANDFNSGNDPLKAPIVGNFDNDQDLEVLVSSSNNTILIIEQNPDDPEYGQALTIYEHPGLLSATPLPADFDGDGQLELFVQDGTHAVILDIKTSPALHIEPLNDLPLKADHIKNLLIADLNNDGYLDIPISMNTITRTSQGSLIFENPLHILTYKDNRLGHLYYAPAHAPIPKAIGDIDQDGEDELLMSLYINPGQQDTIKVLESLTGSGEIVWPQLHYNDKNSNHFDQVITLRGDANTDGFRDLSDAVFILNWLFLNGPDPIDPKIADVNNNNIHEITDAVYLLNYLFLKGPPPPR